LGLEQGALSPKLFHGLLPPTVAVAKLLQALPDPELLVAHAGHVAEEVNEVRLVGVRLIFEAGQTGLLPAQLGRRVASAGLRLPDGLRQLALLLSEPLLIAGKPGPTSFLLVSFPDESILALTKILNASPEVIQPVLIVADRALELEQPLSLTLERLLHFV
jgi:hypothetical protein